MSSPTSWAYLSRTIEGPSRALHELLSAGRDADEIARGVRRRASWLGDLAGETQARYATCRAEEDLAAAAELGARLVTPDCAEWPGEQFDYAFGARATGLSEHGRTYQADAVAPHALWVTGRPLTELLARAVAVVGTRAATNYGAEVTRRLVHDLAGHQWTIVSGGALGIDTAAHRAALDAATPTIAITACGVGHVYPASNRELFADIARHGAVVTEYPPGDRPQRHRFLTRNRLVAALTQGTVVVEAAWRSGALNTLTWAEGLGRIAMAVPGPVTSVASLGCHGRLRDGRAQLVATGTDIRALLEPIGAVDADAQYEIAFQATDIQRLSRNEMRVFDALPVSGDLCTEDVARQAGLTLALCVTILLDLAQRNIVVRHNDGWARRD
ncbi:DNA-processing protein DprA [Corynebacterium uterequi]|uniref:DNA protecting protein DprA n=1 Tax=Corynebacterium uterequi TaxID=1072256 RepID=A0A0G3HJQ7_9CORY|nr:DNA-processing protein DprA [Corynebacterium uterequi]AKK11357.1 DNA protecting protein DprA [Corynebacterium uterequi]